MKVLVNNEEVLCDKNIVIEEEMLKFVVQYVVDRCKEEIDFCVYDNGNCTFCSSINYSLNSIKNECFEKEDSIRINSMNKEIYCNEEEYISDSKCYDCFEKMNSTYCTEEYQYNCSSNYLYFSINRVSRNRINAGR